MASVCEVIVKKYPRTPHLPFSPGVQEDDIIMGEMELSSLPLLAEEAVATEKLDGANCSIFCGNVYARTVNSPANHPSFGPIKELASRLSYSLPDNIQLFGENMFGVHSIEYDRLTSFFYLFAGLKDSEQWMDWDELCELAKELDLHTVPLLSRQTFSTLDTLRQAIQLKESSCGSCPAEGVVVRTVKGFPYNQLDRHTAKYVRKDHIQTDSSWRRTWKQATLVK